MNHAKLSIGAFIGISLATIHGAGGGSTWAKSIPSPRVADGAAKADAKSKGLVNYVGILNRRLAKGITPANNAAIPILSVCRADIRFGATKKINGKYIFVTNHALKRQFLAGLGITEQQFAGPRYDHLSDYLKVNTTLPRGVPAGKGIAAGFPNNLNYAWQIESAAASRPWSAHRYPWLADWLDGNKAAIKKVMAATNLPNFYTPPLIIPRKTSLMRVLTTYLAAAKSLAEGLTIRAMLELHRHDFAACESDLLAAHRLAKLITKPPSLINNLVGYSMEALVCEADEAVANVGWVTPVEYSRYIHKLRQLPRFRRLASVLNTAARFRDLDFLQRMPYLASGAPRLWSWQQMPAAKWSTHDVVLADHLVNRYFNRQVAVFELCSGLKRLRAARKLHKWWTHLLVPANRAIPPKVSSMLILLSTFNGSLVSLRTSTVSANELADMSLLLAEYRAKHGHYPKSLSVLVPHYIKVLPRDPFSGMRLGYSLGPKRCRVWTLAQFLNLHKPPPPNVHLRHIVRLSIPPGHFVWPKVTNASN